jgi:putative phosphoesterase
VDVVVLADTHVRPGGSLRLPEAVLAAVASADAVLHAGDVLTRELLDDLSRHAPVHAVLGNNDDADLAATLPETLHIELGGVAVAMVHDSGATAGRERRMHRRFPDAAIVVFGHSHAPLDGPGVDGQLLFNPGSATQRRRQPRPTFGRLRLAGGRIRRREILAVGPDGRLLADAPVSGTR